MKETTNKSQAELMADITYELLDRCQYKLEKIADGLGLTLSEFKALRAFKTDNLTTVGELARRMELSNSRLTRILDGLEEKGIIERFLNKDDRRVMNVIVTVRGKEITEKLFNHSLKTHQEIIELLSPESRDSVIFAMEKLRNSMNEWVKI